MGDKFRYPINSSFPMMLTFRAEDEYGNERDVVYYNADTYMSIHGRVEDLMKLAGKPKFDFGEEQEHD